MIDDGILVLNKPGNWTSHDCVAVCRRMLRLKGVKKIGHGGTLDPMAEGVLPIFIGQATRIMEYLELDQKTYVCRARLGLVTDTQDIWGQVLDRRPFDGIGEEEILDALQGFQGVIEQMPPIYSAVRVDGKHLYEYARKGWSGSRKASGMDAPARADGKEEVPPDPVMGSVMEPVLDPAMEKVLERVKPRRVYIRDLEVQDMDLQEGVIAFRVTCSKGTYIRTLCSDLGEKLGCGAVMTALKRTAIGSIGLDPSVSPADIKAGTAGDLDSLLIPADQALVHFGKAIMPLERARYFRQGNSIRRHQIEIRLNPQVSEDPLTGAIPCNARGRRYDRIYRIYQEDGMFIGTGYLDPDKRVMRADKVFAPLNEPKGRNK